MLHSKVFAYDEVSGLDDLLGDLKRDAIPSGVEKKDSDDAH